MGDGTGPDLLAVLERGQQGVDQVIRALQHETPAPPARERATRRSIRSSRWIRLRISSHGTAPLRPFGLLLRLPLHPAAWTARGSGKRVPLLDGTLPDELQDALGSASGGDASFRIDVEDRAGDGSILVSID